MKPGRMAAQLIASGFLAAGHVTHAQAQAYPSRPVTIVVPYAAGGPTDAAARLLAEHFKLSWKETVVVDNRPGANAQLGTLAVARAAPDGHTLLFAGVSLPSYKVLYKKPEIDVERDLAPVSIVYVLPLIIMVSAETPVSTLAEFIRYAKARPGKLAYATSGGGMTLMIESLNQLAGIELLNVAYKGESPSATALMRNEVQFTFLSPVSAKGIAESGKAKAVALSTATMRSRAMPEVRTALEAGLQGYDQSAWFGVLSPANTPMEIRQALAREIAVFVKQPETLSRFGKFGLEPTSNSPEEFTRMIAAEIARYGEVARKSGIQPE